jgi:hypothetical protein
VPKINTTLNEWPALKCPNCDKTFIRQDEDSLVFRNPKFFCDHCNAELPVLHVEHTIHVTLGLKEASDTKAKHNPE